MTVKKEENRETRYPTPVLLKSKALSGYQQDFAKVLLKQPEYSIGEAKNILDGYFMDK